MTGLAFYAPLKPPMHPTPSGDREMARGVMRALEVAGYRVDLASDLRTHDGQGDVSLQTTLAEQAKREVDRILSDRPKWSAWLTYHSYYKSPDLIGPVVSKAMGIAYVQIESTRARKRLNGPWAKFAESSEAASDYSTAVFYMTQADKQALKAYAPDGQALVHLPPFLPLQTLPPHATPKGQSILSIGMFRSRAKRASYALIAQTLPLLSAPDWHLTIVGDGSERADIEALFAPFGARVRFTGALDRNGIDDCFASSRAFLWPGVDEAYGMVYLEAQAAGVPVVAQDRNGVRDVLAAQGCDPEDGPRAMAARLDRLLLDDACHERAATEARDTLQSRHLLPSAARILHKTLEALV